MLYRIIKNKYIYAGVMSVILIAVFSGLVLFFKKQNYSPVLTEEDETTCELYTPEGWQRLVSDDGKWSVATPPDWYLAKIFGGSYGTAYVIWPPGIMDTVTFPLVDDTSNPVPRSGFNLWVRYDIVVEEFYKEAISTGAVYPITIGGRNVYMYYAEGEVVGYVYIVGFDNVVVEIDTGSLNLAGYYTLIPDLIKSFAVPCD